MCQNASLTLQTGDFINELSMPQLTRFYLCCWLHCAVLLQVLVVVGILFLTLSSLVEVFIIKLVAQSFLQVGETESFHVESWLYGVLVGGMLLVYGCRYFAKVGRIRYVNYVIERLGHGDMSLHSGQLAWLRAVLVEQTQLIIWCLQLVALLGAAFVLAAPLAWLLLLMVTCVLATILHFFRGQFTLQKKLKYNKRDSREMITSRKIFSRVKAAELATGVANLATLVCFLVFLFAVMERVVAPETGVIFLFIVRIFNVTLTGMAGASMRLARAAVYSEAAVRRMTAR